MKLINFFRYYFVKNPVLMQKADEKAWQDAGYIAIDSPHNEKCLHSERYELLKWLYQRDIK